MGKNYKFLQKAFENVMKPHAQASLQFIREVLSSMPGFNEKPCYGTPGFYVGKKMLARIREDGETLVVQSAEREKWMEKDPLTFFITDHYLNYDYVLVSLKDVSPGDLRELLLSSWRNRATKTMIAQYEKA